MKSDLLKGIILIGVTFLSGLMVFFNLREGNISTLFAIILILIIGTLSLMIVINKIGEDGELLSENISRET